MSFECMTWAVKKRLPSNQKLVLLMLANRANEDNNGLCWPSHSTLAEECGMSKTTVKDCICALEAAGLLSVIPRYAESVRLPNYYRLHIENQSMQIERSVVGRVATHPAGIEEVGRVATEGEAAGGYKTVIKPVSKKKRACAKEKAEPIAFDAEAGAFKGISDKQLHLWTEAHPGVAVPTELLRASVWLLANPNRRKSNYAAFLGNWLTSASQRLSMQRAVGATARQPTNKNAAAAKAIWGDDDQPKGDVIDV